MINDWASQIFGIIYCHVATTQESGKKFDVIFTHHLYARWFAETNAVNATMLEVVLVRRTLAWVTRIILLISILMGVSISEIVMLVNSNIIIY